MHLICLTNPVWCMHCKYETTYTKNVSSTFISSVFVLIPYVAQMIQGFRKSFKQVGLWRIFDTLYNRTIMTNERIDHRFEAHMVYSNQFHQNIHLKLTIVKAMVIQDFSSNMQRLSSYQLCHRVRLLPIAGAMVTCTRAEFTFSSIEKCAEKKNVFLMYFSSEFTQILTCMHKCFHGNWNKKHWADES